MTASPPPERIGHYENPFLAVEWHRDPPGGTTCEPLRFPTPDASLSEGWLYCRGGERTAALLVHPRANFARHYAVPGLLDAGIAVLTQNTRFRGNDAAVVHETALLDVAAATTFLRDRYDRVVFVGNSGGASLLTFYIEQAGLAPADRLARTPAGDRVDLAQTTMPPPDALVLLAAHPGEGHYLLHAVDPSVVVEGDPLSCDPALDMYDPANGFAEPEAESRYDPEFVARYRAAQRERIERLDDVAQGRVERRRAARARWRDSGSTGDRRASIATDFMVVYRTDADLRFTDLRIDPSDRTYGTIWGRRPDWSNYGAVGFARLVTPESWLSTWSGLSSHAEIARTGAGVRLPALHVAYRGDHVIFPSDASLVCDSLAGEDLTTLTFPGDHYGWPAGTGRDPAVAAVARWIRDRE
jgi:hypothetical protein